MVLQIYYCGTELLARARAQTPVFVYIHTGRRIFFVLFYFDSYPLCSVAVVAGQLIFKMTAVLCDRFPIGREEKSRES